MTQFLPPGESWEQSWFYRIPADHPEFGEIGVFIMTFLDSRKRTSSLYQIQISSSCDMRMFFPNPCIQMSLEAAG